MLARYIHTTRIQSFKAISFFWLCKDKKKTDKDNDVIFHEAEFSAFLIVAYKNEWHFWNPETKLDKIGLFL